jgi:Spy/CpxP family protein refolding chaperone
MAERPRFWMSRRRWLGIATLAGLGLGAAGMAAATPGWLGHARHGFGHFGGHPGHRFEAEDIAYWVKRTLREVDASDEQVAQVSEIATQAATDLQTLAAAHRERRAAFAEALVAADRAALEQLRTEELAAADGASQRLVTALGDVAEVLTPEQRQRLAEAHAAHPRHD